MPTTTIFYWPSTGVIYGIHDSTRLAEVASSLPAGLASFEVSEEPHRIPWPVPAGTGKGFERLCVVDTTAAPRLKRATAAPPGPDTRREWKLAVDDPARRADRRALLDYLNIMRVGQGLPEVSEADFVARVRHHLDRL